MLGKRLYCNFKRGTEWRKMFDVTKAQKQSVNVLEDKQQECMQNMQGHAAKC